MIFHRCIKCGHDCELIEQDHGGYEEVWGARVWVPAITDVTDCCHTEDYEEIDEDELE